MIILAIDDEEIALKGLMSSIEKAAPDAEVVGFRKSRQALEYAQEHPFDTVFLDIEMPGISGIDCARCLTELNPSVNIIFTTGYSDYAVQAFELHASGYIMKPITTTKVSLELEHLRHTDPQEEVEEECPLVIRAFGEFEVFFQGKPMAFKYRRSKELLAYLVDRQGAWCDNRQVMATLFRDPEGKESYYKQLRKDLVDTFESIGMPDLVMRRRGEICLLATEVTCDYFDWVSGKLDRSAFHGEYMSQYDWAHDTREALRSSLGTNEDD